VNLAATNAEFQLREYHITLVKKEQTVSRAVSSLQRDLRLKKLPRRIECYDNSHIQGTDLVSSMVVFIDGKPKKSEYRKYKIKTVGGNDDFASMREVIERRFKRAVEEKQDLPDLIIIDGGKGQLSSAQSILESLGIADKIVAIGLAKRLDEVFFVGSSESLLLPRTSSSLRLIQHLRDEAHRFAITFHRSLRDKRTLQTELTEIEGIGKKKAELLLKTFGSVEMVRRAEFEDLAKAIGEKTARSLTEHFNKVEPDAKPEE
jgi:excinuclease ABC subunit C